MTDCDRTFVIYTDNPEAKEVLKDEDIVFVDVDESTTTDVKENTRAKFKYI